MTAERQMHQIETSLGDQSIADMSPEEVRAAIHVDRPTQLDVRTQPSIVRRVADFALSGVATFYVKHGDKQYRRNTLGR